MLIEKEFSNTDREEERVFSVLMNEEELRLYSEFLEEREFDFNPYSLTNLKRAARIKIGRARKNLAHKIDMSINNDISTNNRRVVDFLNKKNEIQTNPQYLSKVTDTIRNNNIAVTDNEDIYNGNAASIMKDHFNKIPESFDKSQLGITAKSRGLVVLPQGSTISEAAHEYNHIKNNLGENGIINKMINKIGVNESDAAKLNAIPYISILGNKQERNKEISDAVSQGFDSKQFKPFQEGFEETGVFPFLKRAMYKPFRLREEKNATNFGRKDLLKLGIPEEVVKKDHEVMKAAGKTYNPALNAYKKIPLRNLIQIPSRRGDFGSHVYHVSPEII